MIRTLELAWLGIAILSAVLSVIQFVIDGWEPALWMLVVCAIALVMFRVRRSQRIKYEPKGEKQLYH
jgi:membrane protein implicated in regulation of membrane protease activity